MNRPALRYHGGKFRYAPWIISYFPPHRIYTEAYGGAFSVGLQKERSYAEIYNDLDGEIVNFFRILRDDAKAAQLQKMLELTPFSRKEFIESYDESNCEIERARRLVVRSFMGFGSAAVTRQHKTGFRSNSNRSGTTPSHDWMNYPNVIPFLTMRMQGVVIECRPATQILRSHDSPETLHYVDPPYVHSTRSYKHRKSGQVYNFEMDDQEHRDLAAVLSELEGMVIVSGYPSELYNEIFRGWQCVERLAFADGALERTEAIWLNKAAARQLERQKQQLEMFTSK